MTTQEKLAAFAAAVGQEVGALKSKVNGGAGDLSALTTLDKSNLVNAINELREFIEQSTSIDDSATSPTSTWSSSKIAAEIDLAVSEVVGNAPAALDTLAEIAAAIQNDPNFLANITGTVKYTTQTLSDSQKSIARSNINAADADQFPDADFVSIFRNGLI